MRKDKVRLIFIMVVTVSLLLTTVLYVITSISKGGVNTGNLFSFAVPLIGVAFGIFFISRGYKDVKLGVPLEDERSKKVLTQAAARTFYFSLYWLLAISWFEPYFAKSLFGTEKLDASQIVGGAIGGMTIFFIISWLYNNKKGQLN